MCGLRIADVDFVRGVVYPKVQFKSMTETAAPLKTKYSAAPVPVSRDLTLLLSASVAEYGTDFVVTDGCGAQGKNWDVESAFGGAVEKVYGLPGGASGSTTFGTFSRRCSSPGGVTSRRYRQRCGTARRA